MWSVAASVDEEVSELTEVLDSVTSAVRLVHTHMWTLQSFVRHDEQATVKCRQLAADIDAQVLAATRMANDVAATNKSPMRQHRPIGGR